MQPATHSKMTPGVVVGLIIMANVVLAALSFLVPVADTVQHAFQAHMRTAIALLAMTLFTSAALWFIIGVRHFAVSLRVAYVQLSVGLVMFSFALLQLPIFGLFDLWETAWAKSGGVVIIFVGATMLIYFGMRRFMSLLGLRSWVASFWKITLLLLAIAAATYVVAPSLIQYPNNDDVHAYLAVVAMAAGYVGAAAWLARRIKQAIGESYRRALASLLVALTVLGFAGTHEYVSTYFMNNGTPYNDYGFYLLPFVAAAVCMVFAARAFSFDRLLSAAADPEATTHTEVSDADYIDSILILSSLASRPQDIENILDELRQVTATKGPDGVLSADDKRRLLAVYRSLESFYMSGKDPLRTYEREQLRRLVSPQLARVLRDGDTQPVPTETVASNTLTT